MYVHGCGTIQWGTDNLPVATPPKKNDSPSSSIRLRQQLPSWGSGYVIFFPHPYYNLAGSTLHGSLIGGHRRQSFAESSPSSDSEILSVPSYLVFSESRENREFPIDVYLGLNTCGHLFLIFRPVVSFCITLTTAFYRKNKIK